MICIYTRNLHYHNKQPLVVTGKVRIRPRRGDLIPSSAKCAQFQFARLVSRCYPAITSPSSINLFNISTMESQKRLINRKLKATPIVIIESRKYRYFIKLAVSNNHPLHSPIIIIIIHFVNLPGMSYFKQASRNRTGVGCLDLLRCSY